MYPITIQQAAADDIKDAYDWQKEQKEELITGAEKDYEKLCEHAQHYFRMGDRYRRLKIT